MLEAGVVLEGTQKQDHNYNLNLWVVDQVDSQDLAHIRAIDALGRPRTMPKTKKGRRRRAARKIARIDIEKQMDKGWWNKVPPEKQAPELRAALGLVSVAVEGAPLPAAPSADLPYDEAVVAWEAFFKAWWGAAAVARARGEDEVWIATGPDTADEPTVALLTGRRHDNIMSDFRDLRRDVLEFKDISRVTTYRDSAGREQERGEVTVDGLLRLTERGRSEQAKAIREALRRVAKQGTEGMAVVKEAFDTGALVSPEKMLRDLTAHIDQRIEALKRDLVDSVHSERLLGDRAGFAAASRAVEKIHEAQMPMNGYLVQMLQFLHARGEHHATATDERVAQVQREVQEMKNLLKDLASRPFLEPRPAQPEAPKDYGRTDTITRFCWQAGIGEASKAQVALINERLVAVGAPGHIHGELWPRSVLDNNYELIRRAFADAAIKSVD